jgi:hypothetical protein
MKGEGGSPFCNEVVELRFWPLGASGDLWPSLFVCHYDCYLNWTLPFQVLSVSHSWFLTRVHLPTNHSKRIYIHLVPVFSRERCKQGGEER